MMINFTKKELSYVLIALNEIIINECFKGTEGVEVKVLISRLIDDYNSITGKDYLKKWRQKRLFRTK